MNFVQYDVKPRSRRKADLGTVADMWQLAVVLERSPIFTQVWKWVTGSTRLMEWAYGQLQEKVALRPSTGRKEL